MKNIILCAIAVLVTLSSCNREVSTSDIMIDKVDVVLVTVEDLELLSKVEGSSLYGRKVLAIGTPFYDCTDVEFSKKFLGMAYPRIGIMVEKVKGSQVEP